MNHQRHYHTARWKRQRKRQLRKSPLCKMCDAQGKMEIANVVDHVIPHCGDYALFFDPQNHQSLCKPCHDTKTHYETVRSKYLPPSLVPSAKEVKLIFGPPASGKTTWALKQDDWHVVDLDIIKETISGQNPYEMDKKWISQCLAVRNSIIQNHQGKMIVVATLPEIKVRRRWLEQLNCESYLMATPMHECIKRSNNDPRRSNKRKQKAIIESWFKTYKPTGTEKYING